MEGGSGDGSPEMKRKTGRGGGSVQTMYENATRNLLFCEPI